MLKTQILGVKINNLTISQTLEKVEQFMTDGKQHYIVTANPEFLVQAQKDDEFKNILNQADLAVCDGIGLIFASWFLGQPLKQRITGVDLMEKICCLASRKNWPVFLLGGREGVAEKAVENLRKKCRQLDIKAIKSRNMPSSYAKIPSEDFRCGELLALEQINNNLSVRTMPARNSTPLKGIFSSLDNKVISRGIVFVAFGAPKQEKWIVENLEKMPSIKLAMGVGGAFDFMAGQVSRAPKILINLGLEWFWRLVQEPWRIRRIFRAVVVFPWLVIKSRIN